MQDTRLSIPSNGRQTVEARGFGIATENLNLSSYTPDQQDTLGFWWHLAKDKGWTFKEFERQTGVSTTTLTRLYRGIYQGDIAAQVKKLENAKVTFAHAAENPDFLLTSLAKVMFTAFDKTRALRNVTIMWGVKGIGKTTIMREYTHTHNHGHTFYVRCLGSGCSIAQFIRHVAASMNIVILNRNSYDLRCAILAYLSKGSRLLIVDELHEVFLTCTNRQIVQICEFLRELADVAEVGLALVGTHELHHQFFNGPHKGMLAQMVDRGTVQIQLKAKPTKGDVLLFLGHYELAYPSETDGDALSLLNDIIQSNGLRKLTQHLRDGQAYANKRQETYQWHHFVAAHDAIQSLSK